MVFHIAGILTIPLLCYLYSRPAKIPADFGPAPSHARPRYCFSLPAPAQSHFTEDTVRALQLFSLADCGTTPAAWVALTICRMSAGGNLSGDICHVNPSPGFVLYLAGQYRPATGTDGVNDFIHREASIGFTFHLTTAL